MTAGRARTRLAMAGLLATLALTGAAPSALAAANPVAAPSTSEPPGGRLAPGRPQLPAQGAEENETGELRRREDDFYRQRAFPRAEITPGALQRARRQAVRRGQRFAAPRAAGPLSPALPGSRVFDPNNFGWAPLGPQPMQGGAGTLTPFTGSSPWAGRITAVATHPTSQDVAYVGGAAGGVWKTTNGGTTWAPVGDSIPSLAMGALAIDPGNGNVVFAGTGEASLGFQMYFGAGIFRSTDGGANWSKIGGTTFDRCYVDDIVVRPGNSNVVVAAVHGLAARPHYDTEDTCLHGIYRSTDGGSTWTRVGSTDCLTSDLDVDRQNPDVWYATQHLCGGTSGVYKSTTNATLGSFAPASSGLPVADVGRMQMGVAPSDGSRLYVVIERDSGNDLNGIFTSSNGGASWSALSAPANDAGLDSFCSRQCFYDLTMIVHPTTPGTFLAGGTTLYRFTNFGADFVEVGDTTMGLHWDQQDTAFDAGGRLWQTNDGGVYRSSDLGGTWTNLNAGLAMIQFEPGAAGFLDTALVGGTQDNGFVGYAGGPAWNRLGQFGDAGHSGVDPRASNRLYATYPAANPLGSSCAGAGTFGNLLIYRSDNGGGSFGYVGGPVGCSPESAIFYAPLELDDARPDRLYAGTDFVWRTTNATAVNPSWSHLGSQFAGPITAIATAPSTADVVYAAATDGFPDSLLSLRVTTNATSGAPTWSEISGNGLGNRWVTDIEVDAQSAGTAYVTQSGFGAGHVFMTTTFGAAWTDISGDLPDGPVNAIAVDERTSPDTLFAGTDVGAFWSANGGATWQPAPGLPGTPVLDLLVDDHTDKLLAVTHGRGAFAAPIPNQNPNDGQGRIVFSSNRDGDYDIYAIDADGTDLQQLTNDPGSDQFPSVSADGTRIAFASTRQGGDFDIWTMTNTGASPAIVADRIGADESPSWSPDGTQLVFDADDGTADDEIYRIDANGTNPLQLTNNAAQDRQPDWSPDGATVAFSSDRDTNFELYSVAPAGGAQTRLTTDGATPVPDVNPDFSPNSALLAWDRNTWIHRSAANGSNRVQVTTGNTDDRNPAWSVEGTRLAFQSERDSNGVEEIYTMNSDGTGQFNLSQNLAAQDLHPAWAPVAAPIEADVSVTKADSPDPVTQGASLTYTLTARNDGPAAAPGVTVTDVLPGGVTFVSAVASQGSCSGTSTVTCSLGTLADAAEATITITVTPTAQGTLSNTATVSSSAPSDPVPGNNSDTEATQVNPPQASADLAVTKSDSPDPVDVGQDLTWTIGVSNSGPDAAAGVTVTDQLPAGAQFVSAPGCTNNTGTVTCALGTVASGASPSVTIVVEPQSAGTLSNTVTVSSSTSDPAAQNNSDTESTQVNAPPGSADLGIMKSDSPDPATVNAPLTYGLTVTNSGPDAATGVQVTDTLPAGVTFVSDDPSQGDCTGTATVTCALGDLADGAQATVEIVVTPTTEGSKSNTATVDAVTPDPAAANDSDTETTTVAGAVLCDGQAVTVGGATAGDDTLTGTAGADVIAGLGGNDRLDGLGGNDRICGGLGDDTLLGGAASDVLRGDGGRDKGDFSGAPAAVTVNLAAGTATGDGTDSLVDIEDVAGSPQGDALTGSAGDNRLDGAGGDDELAGAAGDDQLVGGPGARDRVSFASATGPVDVDLATGIATGSGTDALNTLEDVTGSPGDDSLTGDDVDNRIDGGTGADDIQGGNGTDRGEYPRTAAVTVVLDGNAADGNAQDGPAGARDNVAIDVEDLTGGAGGDALVGRAGPNRLDGAGGADFLEGGDGPDVLIGGAGADSGSYGDRGSGERVVVTLDGQANDGEAGEGDNVGPAGDVEDLIGGDSDDSLTGSGLDNGLDGGGGADDLIGGGGAGDFAFYGFRGAGDPVTVTVGGGADDGGLADESLGRRDNVSTEDVVGTGGGDALTGDGQANGLFGGPGGDTLLGGGAADLLVGDDGGDRLDSRGDGASDEDFCGGGADTAKADPGDALDACEAVTIGPDPTPTPDPTASPGPGPSGSPTPPPPPTPARAPELKLSGASAQKVLRQRAVLVTAACDIACRVSASGSIRGAGRPITLGRVSRDLPAGGRATLRLKVPARALTTLRKALRGRALTARTIVTAQPTAGGPQRSQQRNVRLRR